MIVAKLSVNEYVLGLRLSELLDPFNLLGRYAVDHSRDDVPSVDWCQPDRAVDRLSVVTLIPVGEMQEGVIPDGRIPKHQLRKVLINGNVSHVLEV